MALFGSAWFGLGCGLLLGPGFWGALIPWSVSTLDAQGLGIWALALGAGILGALAEDDLMRVRPALWAVTGVGIVTAAVLALRAGDVDWSGVSGLALAVLVAGLILTGLLGAVLLRRATGEQAVVFTPGWVNRQ